MKKIQLPFLLLFTLGTVFINFGQEVGIVEDIKEVEVKQVDEVEQEKVIEEEKKKTKKIEHKHLKISVEISDEWKIRSSKKSKSLHLENSINGSKVEISSMAYKLALEKVFKSEKEEDFKEILSILDSIKSTKNFTYDIQFAISQSKTRRGYVFYKCQKTLNKKGFLIKVKVKQDCNDCEKSYKKVIDSMTLLL